MASPTVHRDGNGKKSASGSKKSTGFRCAKQSHQSIGAGHRAFRFRTVQETRSTVNCSIIHVLRPRCTVSGQLDYSAISKKARNTGRFEGYPADSISGKRFVENISRNKFFRSYHCKSFRKQGSDASLHTRPALPGHRDPRECPDCGHPSGSRTGLRFCISILGASEARTCNCRLFAASHRQHRFQPQRLVRRRRYGCRRQLCRCEDAFSEEDLLASFPPRHLLLTAASSLLIAFHFANHTSK